MSAQCARHSDPPKPDLAFRLQSVGLDHAVVEAEQRSPVRKKRQLQRKRRQSLPARLSPSRAEEPSGGGVICAGAAGVSVLQSAWLPCHVPYAHLSARQKIFYARVTEVCNRVSTQPLPVRVLSITGHGEFFNGGDPIPKSATLVVHGTEDPLVKGLRLDELCLAALSERARRRNKQMMDAVQEALGKEGKHSSEAGVDEKGGRGGPEWWTQLCANKHLTEDSTLKRVRDGEPLGSVADGVEWALRETIRARSGHIPTVGNTGNACSSTRCSEDMAILVRVARQWAKCLTWSRVTYGSWSYQGITTRLLKQGVPQVDVVVKIAKLTAATARGREGREKGLDSITDTNIATTKPTHKNNISDNITFGYRQATTKSARANEGRNRQDLHREASGSIDRDDIARESSNMRGNAAVDGVNHDYGLGRVGVSLWRPDARDVDANLADVFQEEGRDEAVRDAAVATAQRIEMLGRCYALLRVALQDVIEGKASTSMVQGVSSKAVTEAFLRWLQHSVAPRKVLAQWARNTKAVSQVVKCIALSIEREAKVSDAVASWTKNAQPREKGHEVIIESSVARFQGNTTVSDAEFNRLKRAEAQKKRETDTVAVIVHHALYLVLPCQPVQFHFVWGRFMRFFYGMSLYQHIARYYTEAVNSAGGCSFGGGTGSWGLVTPVSNGTAQRDAATYGSERTSTAGVSQQQAGDDSATAPSTPTRAERARADAQGRAEILTPTTPPSFSCRQVAGNLVKPRELESRPSFRGAPWTPPYPHPSLSAAAATMDVPPYPHPSLSAAAATMDVTNQQQQRHSQALIRDATGAGIAWEAEDVAARGGGRPGSQQPGGRGQYPPALTPLEAAVANECLVSLLAIHGTATRLATGPQVAAALSREGFPDAVEALALLKDSDALRGEGVRARLWRMRKGAALVRVRCEDSLFARLPPELFRNVLRFISC